MRFLTEIPIKKDLLDGQTHDLLSDAIAKEILSDEANTIGLDGELGSGKSSVIEMVKEKTKGSATAVEFIDFDVELYHNNNVSKALINTIYDKLSLLNDFSGSEAAKKSLKKVRDEALGYVVKYEREVDSPLSGALGVFAISLIILAEIFTDFLKSLAESLSSIGDSKFDAENFALICAFLIVTCVIWLTASKAKQKFGNLISQKVPETIKDTLEVSTEVGSYELHKALIGFKSLLKNDRTVVLVIDNLDRVPQESFLQVWSDLEVFTHIKEDTNDVTGNLKLLIPFSSSHVANSIATTVLTEEESGNLSSKKLAGYEFISKRIPIQFRLPEQVNADWKNLTKKLLEAAEMEFDESQLNTVLKFIEMWKPKFQPTFTPRYIKFLINEMVSLLKVQPEIDRLITAAYTCIIQEGIKAEQLLGLTSTNQANENLLNTMNLLKKSSNYQIPEVRQEFAKLHFQTKNGEVAISQLLVQELKNNLTQEDIPSFCYSDRYYYREALKDVLESIELSERLDILSSFNNSNEELYKSWLQQFFCDYFEHIEISNDLSNSNILKVSNAFSNISKLLPEEVLLSDNYLSFLDGLKNELIELLKSDEYEESQSSEIVLALYNVTYKYDLKLDSNPILLNSKAVLNTCSNNLEDYSYWEEYFDTKPISNRKIIIEEITKLNSDYADSVGHLFRKLIEHSKVGGSFFQNEQEKNLYKLECIEDLKMYSEKEQNIIPESILFTQEFVNQQYPFSNYVDNAFIQEKSGEELLRIVAALFVYYINANELDRAINIATSYKAEIGAAEEYINLYLQLCMNFSSVLSAARNVNLSEYVLSPIKSLIKDKKVEQAMSYEIFAGDGEFICELFPTNEDIALNFINYWTSSSVFKEAQDLIDAISFGLLEYCIEKPNSELSQTLLSKYDEYTKTRDWLEQIHSLDTPLELENKLYRAASKFRSSYSQINNTVKSLISESMECDFELQALPDLLSTLHPKAKEKLIQYCSDLFWSDKVEDKNSIKEWMVLNVDYLLEKPSKWTAKHSNKLLNLVDFSDEILVWAWAKERLTDNRIKLLNKKNKELFKTLKESGKLG